MQQRRGSAGRKAALLGIFALAVGVAVYLLIRDSRSLYLSTLISLPEQSTWVINYMPRQLIWLSGSLPTATHAFAFSLLTAVALGLKKLESAIACVAWAIIGVSFEFLQSLEACPGIFSHGQQMLPNFWCAYISAGVFDWFDIGSILLGAGLAYLSLQRLSHNSGDANE